MDQDVMAYFQGVPEARRERLLALQTLILATLPQAKVGLWYKMPTYRTATGWVAIANQKGYVSLYTCSAAHIAGFKAKHPDYRTGTGCINFRDRDRIPLDDLREVILHAAGRGGAV